MTKCVFEKDVFILFLSGKGNTPLNVLCATSVIPGADFITVIFNMMHFLRFTMCVKTLLYFLLLLIKGFGILFKQM